MNETIDMALKPIFFRAIKSGAKTTEYRDFTDYWGEKLIDIESYGGMSVKDIKDAIFCGEKEFRPRNYKRILFHESGTQRTMMVECLGINYYQGHLGFALRLGKIIKQTNKEL